MKRKRWRNLFWFLSELDFTSASVIDFCVPFDFKIWDWSTVVNVNCFQFHSSGFCRIQFLLKIIRANCAWLCWMTQINFVCLLLPKPKLSKVSSGNTLAFEIKGVALSNFRQFDYFLLSTYHKNEDLFDRFCCDRLSLLHCKIVFDYFEKYFQIPNPSLAISSFSRNCTRTKKRVHWKIVTNGRWLDRQQEVHHVHRRR